MDLTNSNGFLKKTIYGLLLLADKLGFAKHISDSKVTATMNGTPKKYKDLLQPRFKAVVSYCVHQMSVRSFDKFTIGSNHEVTFFDHTRTIGDVSVLAEITDFLVQVDPVTEVWVSRTSPTFMVNFDRFAPVCVCNGDIQKDIEYKTVTCDFFKCRYKKVTQFQQECIPPIEPVVEKVIEELSISTDRIQEDLCGIKYDGSCISKYDKSPLADDLLCASCGCPVFSTSRPNRFLCPNHGVLTHDCVQRVSHSVWKGQYSDWATKIDEMSII